MRTSKRRSPQASINRSLWPAVFLMCLLLVMPPATAFSADAFGPADAYWTGDYSVNWSDPGNWVVWNDGSGGFEDLGRAVETGDTIHFGSGINYGNSVINNNVAGLQYISIAIHDDYEGGLTLTGNPITLAPNNCLGGGVNLFTVDLTLSLSGNTIFNLSDEQRLQLNRLNFHGYELTTYGYVSIAQTDSSYNSTWYLRGGSELNVRDQLDFSGTLSVLDTGLVSVDREGVISDGHAYLSMGENASIVYDSSWAFWIPDRWGGCYIDGTVDLGDRTIIFGNYGEDGYIGGNIIATSPGEIAKAGSGQLTIDGGGGQFNGTLTVVKGIVVLEDGFSTGGDLTVDVLAESNILIESDDADIDLNLYGANNIIYLRGGTFSQSLSLTSGSLTGSGYLSGDVSLSNNAVLSPGGNPPAGFAPSGVIPAADIGIFIISGGLTVSSDFDVDIDGTGAGDSGYDQVRVSGGVNITGADLNLTWGSTPASDDKFAIIQNNGSAAVNGTFNGLAEGDTIVAGTQTMYITYRGGNGNDVVIYGPDADPMDAINPVIDDPGEDGGTGLAAPVILPSKERDMAAEGFSLEWTSVSGASAYRVYRSTSQHGYKTFLGHTAANGWTDITAEPGQTYYYWVRAQGSGSTSGYSKYSTGWRLEVNPGLTGDLDGDGSDELLWYGVTSGQLSYWDNKVSSSSSGSSNLLSRIIYSTDEIPVGADESASLAIISPDGSSIPSDQAHLLGTGDLDGDGDDEIIWRDLETGMVTAWVTAESPNGLQTQIELYLASAGEELQLASIGDINGDGKDDILWRNENTGQLWVWEMDGGQIAQQWEPALGRDILSESTADACDLGWQVAALEDFNADGKCDILWEDQESGDLCLWIMDGRNPVGIQTVDVPAEDQDWVLAGMGDLNGDGKADLVVGNNVTGECAIVLLDGLELYQAASLTADDMNGDWDLQDIGDLNGDGKDDLYLRNGETGKVCYFYMNGTTVLREEIIGTASDYRQ